MNEKRISNVQKVLLSALKSKRGIAVGHIAMMSTIPSYSSAYQTAMYAKKKGLLEKIGDKFFITENGKQKLRDDGFKHQLTD